MWIGIGQSLVFLKQFFYGYCMTIMNVSGLSNLTSLSFRRNNAITAKGMSAFANLVNLVKLDLERCPEIHGGLVNLKGMLFSTSTLVF